MAELLVNFVRQLDSTRPVTSAVVGGNAEIYDPLFAVHDIGGYNYGLHMATKDHERVPSRIIVQTESFPRDAFYNWQMSTDHKYILGDFVWSAIDYLGETGIGRYTYPGEPVGEHWDKKFHKNAFPWHGADCGDIDLTGLRKPISHYRDLLYNEGRKLYMAVKEPNDSIKTTAWAVWPTWESWTWPAQAGKNIDVEVYSRYPQVRLYLNNKLIGEKQAGKEHQFKATFTLPYSPGSLKAVGVLNNKEQQSTILKTAGTAAKIRLTADRNKIKANGQDLSYITVEITDKDGSLQHFAENSLTFTVKGAGIIAAVGNANLKDPDPYVANTRKAWKGRATVIVKSTQNAGAIVLEVSAPGLPKSAITINSTH
jgi:beta-galactosidase